MKRTLRSALALAGLVAATQAIGQVTFYGNEGFGGGAFTADRPVANFEQWGFNDRASSAVVDRGTWQVCEDEQFRGRCVVLQPGQYPSLREMGLDNRVSSVRPVQQAYGYNDNRGHDNRGYDSRGYDSRGYAVAAPDNSRWHRREGERLFEVPVTGVRAVVGPPEQRCWVERQQVVEGGGNDPNIPGAVIGGVIGGILGHQIGAGTGRDIATVGGAVAGAAVGGNINRGGAPSVSTQDVQRCADVPRSSAVDYYDVTYVYGGREHHVQMTSPPGRTLLVNRDGEPRVQ